MPTAPLKPFALPTGFGNFVLSLPTAMVWIFWFAIACWAIYTLIAIYHWFKYSHASLVAIPAIALHLFISLVLISYSVSGLI